MFGLVWLLAGLSMAWRQGLRPTEIVSALAVGLLVMAGWAFTSQMTTVSFDPQPVRSLSFSGPSANLLMMILATPGGRFDFDAGLVPGVVLGSFVSAFFARELKLEGFHDGWAMRRYITGAVLMGFGSMLAGGCAIGAGVSGAAVFATTAWLTLLAMWLAAGLTDRLLDAPDAGTGKITPRGERSAGMASAEPAMPQSGAFTP